MDNNDEEDMQGYGRGRETNFGLNSEEYNQLDLIIQRLIAEEDLSLTALVEVLERNPQNRNEMVNYTPLLEEIFKRKDLVQDLISFLSQPRLMADKYSLTLEQTKKYTRRIVSLIKENEEFYIFYFLMLEQSSILVQQKGETEHSIHLRRTGVGQQVTTLDLWFQFLSKEGDRDELSTSLGYFTEIFIPFVKFQFGQSSTIEEHYQTKYGKKGMPILLISHFHPALVHNILKYTHHEPIFKCLFTLVRISIEEDEWKDSLNLLKQLYQSALINQVTSDRHIEFICNMVKEVKDNISKDKDGAVFAFLEGIIKSKLVTAALRRLQEILTLGEYQAEIEDVIENNMQFLLEMVHIYYVLLKNGISKSTKTVEELRMEVLKIKEKVGELILLVRGFPEWSITFSNGENLKATPMFRYHFFGILKYILLYLQNYGVSDQGMRLNEEQSSAILQLIQSSLAENRWNSIMHRLIEKLIGLIITTESFKTKNPSLNSFLEFLILAFTNKQYVFLNSARMVNQGDLSSLYHICCKVTKCFEGACKSVGIKNQYEEWGSFVVHVLQNYEFKTEKTLFKPEEWAYQEQDLERSGEIIESKETFAGYIDQADEADDIKLSIDKIDTIQKWNRDKTVKRTRSIPNIFPLLNKSKERRESNSPTSAATRARCSVPQQSFTKPKPGLRFQMAKKISNYEHYQQKVPNLQKIVSFDKRSSSSENKSSRSIKSNCSDKGSAKGKATRSKVNESDKQ